MRIARLALLVFCFAAATAVLAQDHSDQAATATCAFADGKQISVRYSQPHAKQTEIFGKIVPFGKTWKPGGNPILLFTETSLALEGATIPAGAYELYPTPGPDQWKLDILRPLSKAGGAEAHQKIASVSLAKGRLPEPLSLFTIYFGRMGDRQCNMRMYWGNTGVWAEFNEK
jgi:Protein of unknown function (DUF2911)